nr:hypothetical protein GCM10020093_060500 [Planobispora longispora]
MITDQSAHATVPGTVQTEQGAVQTGHIVEGQGPLAREGRVAQHHDDVVIAGDELGGAAGDPHHLDHARAAVPDLVITLVEIQAGPVDPVGSLVERVAERARVGNRLLHDCAGPF